MIQINDPLFQESFHFIRNNPYATTDILPSKLLSLWSADDSGNDSLPFQAFMTAFLAFNVRKTGETKFNIDMDRL
ncbi:hypothetical protein LJB97_04695, partial [Parabacteroides sp. OttesenSCG-928-O15]|nr:hypothetical protein [Parabacteroides sp. OttesenSCG-928-O15]